VDQSQKSKDSPLALVVGVHDVPEVFDSDYDDERPKDERQYAQDSVIQTPALWNVRDALAHGVKRARADVAEDNAQRTHAQGGFPAEGQALGAMLGHFDENSLRGNAT
jgi:hypothetical protein